ncbi:hypothetical protein AB0D38_14255 [Streptomyces sp. NPDC048279]|uniref:hypothetical protein n=1 Tax=Streptomyces sp. NPDC048279 TaxID=3154714 RepID=UPI003444101B
MTGRAPGGAPEFFVLSYITITRDPRTRLVVAIGGDERAAGILQTAGGFNDAPGPRGPYHRQPHTMAVDEQRTGATAAALALLQAGYSVHLDPALNTLSRRARTGRPPTATWTTSPNAPATPATATNWPPSSPRSSLPPTVCCPACATSWCLSGRVGTTASTTPDAQRPPAEQLIDTVNALSRHTQRLQDIRNQAARIPASAPSPGTTAKPVPAAPGRSR